MKFKELLSKLVPDHKRGSWLDDIPEDVHVTSHCGHCTYLEKDNYICGNKDSDNYEKAARDGCLFFNDKREANKEVGLSKDIISAIRKKQSAKSLTYRDSIELNIRQFVRTGFTLPDIRYFLMRRNLVACENTLFILQFYYSGHRRDFNKIVVSLLMPDAKTVKETILKLVNKNSKSLERQIRKRDLAIQNYGKP